MKSPSNLPKHPITSPILYLLLINHLDLLPQLYGQIIIPEIVRDELLDPGAPVELQQWITNPLGWLRVERVTSTPDTSLNKLNPGERAAIALAQEYPVDLLIIDELCNAAPILPNFSKIF